MEHCFTPCTVVSNDEYRIRYDCRVCKRTFYSLKQRESTQVGETVLKNGSPFIICGWCTQEEKLHWSKIIRILIRWESNGSKYDTIQHYNRLLPANYLPGTRIVVPAFKPIIKQVKGCRECYNLQNSETAKIGRLHYFNGNNTPKVETEVQTILTPTLYNAVETYDVVPYRFPSGDGATVQRGWNTNPDDYEGQ